MHPILTVGTLSVPSYGLFMVLGIVIAFSISHFRLRRHGISFDSLILVVAVALAIGLAGAQISYYVFSYGISRLFQEVMAGDYSGFDSPGLVFYGGLLGGVIAAIITIRLLHLDFDNFANSVIPCVPLGHAFGRIGCLLAGCCYGLHYHGPFAVHSIYVSDTDLLFPIQAVEAILNLIFSTILFLYTKKKRPGSSVLGLYLIMYSTSRFILEFFRGDIIRGVYAGLSSSQWISLFLIPIGVVFLKSERILALSSTTQRNPQQRRA